MNRLLVGELNMTFFCKNEISSKNVTVDSNDDDKKNILDFYVVKNGNIEKNETLKDLSQEYVSYMLKEFNLTDYLEKKYFCKKYYFFLQIITNIEKLLFLNINPNKILFKTNFLSIN